MINTHLPQKQRTQRTKLVLFASAMLILLCTLAFGLAPRGNFADEWVFWNKNSSQTRFGQFGLVTGDLSELETLSELQSSLSFSFTLTPELPKTNSFTILLQLNNDEDALPFIIGQWKTFFIVMQGMDFRNEKRAPRLIADLADHIGQSVNLKITVGALDNKLSINGNLQSSIDSLAYSLKKDAAKISIGNSPDGKRGWRGNIEQLTIHLQDGPDESDTLIRDYAFNQDNLPLVYDIAKSKSHLLAPKPGRFPSPNILKQISIKQFLDGNLLTDFLLNIVGFIPLGFVTALLYWFTMKQPSFNSRLVVTALIFGFLVSIFIEYTQIFLPGRSSHLHDLLLNVAGQLSGIAIFGLCLKFTNLGNQASRNLAAKHD